MTKNAKEIMIDAVPLPNRYFETFIPMEPVTSHVNCSCDRTIEVIANGMEAIATIIAQHAVKQLLTDLSLGTGGIFFKNYCEHFRKINEWL